MEQGKGGTSSSGVSNKRLNEFTNTFYLTQCIRFLGLPSQSATNRGARTTEIYCFTVSEPGVRSKCHQQGQAPAAGTEKDMSPASFPAAVQLLAQGRVTPVYPSIAIHTAFPPCVSTCPILTAQGYQLLDLGPTHIQSDCILRSLTNYICKDPISNKVTC